MQNARNCRMCSTGIGTSALVFIALRSWQMDERARSELGTVGAAVVTYGMAATVAIVAVIALFAGTVTWFGFPLGLAPCAVAYAALCLVSRAMRHRWPNIATAVVASGAVGLFGLATLAIVTGAYVIVK